MMELLADVGDPASGAAVSVFVASWLTGAILAYALWHANRGRPRIPDDFRGGTRDDHDIVDELTAILATLRGYQETLPGEKCTIAIPPSPERAAVMVDRLRMRLVQAWLDEQPQAPGADDQEAPNLRFPLR